jgi:hypothetical protein
MSETETHPNRRVGPFAIGATALGLLAMPLLYVLSIGPMIWIFGFGNGLPAWVRDGITWYVVPMELTMEHFPSIAPWVNRYFELWY